MAVKIEGVDQLFYRIDRAGENSRSKMSKLLREGAEDIAQRAREYAPIDHGNLEKAIEVEPLGGERDYRGRFTKISYVVQVNPEATGFKGEPLLPYAYEMHEHQTPNGGKYKLGERSLQKDGGRGVVGGGYMERAVDDIENDLMSRMIDVIREEF